MYRLQVPLTVSSLVEDALAADDGLRPIRIKPFVSIGGDPGASGELAKVGAGDFGVRVIQRIEVRAH
jgi:hypothetical protein